MNIIIRKDENYRKIKELLQEDSDLKEEFEKLINRIFYSKRDTLEDVLREYNEFKEMLDDLTNILKIARPLNVNFYGRHFNPQEEW